MAGLCLLQSLSAADVQQFEQIVHRSRPVHTGEHLFRVGDEFRSIAVVRTGCLKSYVIDHGGQEQVLGFTLPGTANLHRPWGQSRVPE